MRICCISNAFFHKFNHVFILPEVYIQTRHVSHAAVEKVRRACKRWGVGYNMMDVGVRCVMKAEGRRLREQAGG